MKFRKKPVEVEANVFQWGMESGVIRYNEHIPKDGQRFPEEMRSKEHEGYLSKYDNELDNKGFERGQWQPYIETIHAGQKVIVKPDDYIIAEPDGLHFYPCKPDIFEAIYEKVG